MLHRIPTAVFVVLMLGSIAVANLLTAHDPSWIYVNAFVLIGLDLTTRDVLDDRWKGRRVFYLGLLVVAGAAIAYVANPDAHRIAVASAVAFAAAFTTDSLVYAQLRSREWLERANLSNIPSALVDSIVFPLLAFPGGLDWKVVIGLAGTKIGGGAMWSLLLNHARGRLAPA